MCWLHAGCCRTCGLLRAQRLGVSGNEWWPDHPFCSCCCGGCAPACPCAFPSCQRPACRLPYPCSPQNQLQAELPFCAFNGGNDVFVDVGNKSLGLEALMNHLACTPSEVRRSAGLVLCGRESTV